MGMYIYISEIQRKTMRKVSDENLNELFQEALTHDSSLMIEEVTSKIKKGWFKSIPTIEYSYNIYHEEPAFDGSAYQARFQISGSGKKGTVIAYLCGIINGSLHAKYEKHLKLEDELEK